MKNSRTPRRLLLPAVLGFAVLPLLAACGGDDSSATSTPDPTVSTAAVAPTGPTDAGETSAPDASTDPTGAGGGTPVLTDGSAPAARTVTISEDGTFSPTSLSIGVGQTVTFKAADKGVFAVEVGGLDGKTVTGGLIETFEFPSAGSYPVTEDITGTSMTITVG